ncbi:MAG: DUF805 domain-containing protein [Oscillospiraceae bacterium]|jgi:uncharacterized membrane protein YhaH (DUF805 family)|nr:DUF805 domain-containing protein [Oscillospiraceae bacterium]
MFTPLKKYLVFKGRARRSEYWLWLLFVFIVTAVIGLVLNWINPIDFTTNPPTVPAINSTILGLLHLFFFLPSWGVTVRRLHDTNRSGWWLLIGLIPLIGEIWLFILYILSGTKGENKYGPDPKAQ